MRSVEVVKADITKLRVDAIVNAANNRLLAGSGVCGAIHRAAGPELQKECQQHEGCETGSAVITEGYNLPAKFVLHTVGPVYSRDTLETSRLLASCYSTCFNLCVEHGLLSVAFPCISTGIYGYPKREAAEIAVKELFNHQADLPTHVTFCCFEHEDYEIYRSLL